MKTLLTILTLTLLTGCGTMTVTVSETATGVKVVHTGRAGTIKGTLPSGRPYDVTTQKGPGVIESVLSLTAVKYAY